MPLFRRKREDEQDVSNVLYVHLGDDGGIFAVRGDTGAQAWIPHWLLEEEIERIKAAGGTLLYSRDAPDRDPPEIVERTFRRIVELEPPSVKLLEEPHADARLEGGATTLMLAAHIGEDDLIRDLIERGADLEARDDAGYTALMYACNGGQLRSVELLLDAGADVNARDKDGSTPAMFAAQHGYAEIVQRLIEHGADLGIRGDHGLTALGFAQQNGHAETAGVLERAGAAA